MQWKQWCTDEHWGRAVLLVPEEDVRELASFRPPCLDMEFSARQPILDWINRFEVWCSTQPVGKYKDFENEFRWLRAIVSHQVPGEYSTGTTVDALLQDLKALPHARPQGPRKLGGLQNDAITQLFPGSDIPSIPAENLVRIDGITHTVGGRRIRSNVIYPGSLLVVRVPEDTKVQGLPVRFLVAVAVETNARMSQNVIVVVWYVPGTAPVENLRGGAKKKILDIFGPWTRMHNLTAPELRMCRLPPPVAASSQILEFNFEFTDDMTLPYEVFDDLRTRHDIDVTGFKSSFTHKGSLYRNYALLGGDSFVKTHDVHLWAQASSLVGPLLVAMSLLDELITTSQVLDLKSCRGLCGIPASITHKKDLVEALLLQTRCPHKRRSVIRQLTDNMNANALRSWISLDAMSVWT